MLDINSIAALVIGTLVIGFFVFQLVTMEMDIKEPEQKKQI